MDASGRLSDTAGTVCRRYPAAGTARPSWRCAVPAKCTSARRPPGNVPAADALQSASAMAMAGYTCPPVPPAANNTRKGGRSSATSSSSSFSDGIANTPPEPPEAAATVRRPAGGPSAPLHPHRPPTSILRPLFRVAQIAKTNDAGDTSRASPPECRWCLSLFPFSLSCANESTERPNELRRCV